MAVASSAAAGAAESAQTLLGTAVLSFASLFCLRSDGAGPEGFEDFGESDVAGAFSFARPGEAEPPTELREPPAVACQLELRRELSVNALAAIESAARGASEVMDAVEGGARSGGQLLQWAPPPAPFVVSASRFELDPPRQARAPSLCVP